MPNSTLETKPASSKIPDEFVSVDINSANIFFEQLRAAFIDGDWPRFQAARMMILISLGLSSNAR